MVIIYSRNRNFRAGFTLLELLTALTILSFVIACIYAAFSAGNTAQKKCRKINDLIGSARNSLTIMTIEMRNAVYYSDMYMDGTSQKVSFLTPSPLAETTAAGDENKFSINKITYYFDPEKDNAGSLKKNVQTWLDKGPAGRSEKMEGDTILSNVSGFKISYCRKKNNGIQGGAFLVQKEGVQKMDDFEWIDAWESKDGFPLGVKIEFTLSENAADKQDGKTSGRELKIVKILYPEYALSSPPELTLNAPPVLLENKEDAQKAGITQEGFRYDPNAPTSTTQGNVMISAPGTATQRVEDKK